MSTISRRLILAALLVAGCAGQARAVSFTCVQAGPTTWIYNLTFDPEDNYSIFQGTTTITLSGLSGVTQAFAPTSTDFTGSAAMVNLAWSPSVLNGGTTVVWSHTGGGTGNFGVPKHVNGFSITSGAPAGVVSISTSGVSRDMDNPLPGGTFNVDISGTVIGPSGTQASTGSLAQIASGQGWDTSLTLVSLGPTAFPAALSFFADQTGSPLSLPFTYPQGALAATSGPTLTQTLNTNAVLVMDTTGPLGQPVNVGWSQLQAAPNLGGYAIFTNTPNNWQAVVPLETRNASSYLLAFDNTGSLATGLAIANLVNQPASVNVVLRDGNGQQLGVKTINLAARGHTSFMLNTTYTETAGLVGTVEFDTPVSGQISVVGLRANGPALTTVPVLASVGNTGGSLGHITYNGGWQTTITLVNTGSTTAQASLNFFDDNGNPLVVTLFSPQQQGSTFTSSGISPTLGAGATFTAQLQGQDALNSISGSALLTSTGKVSGFAIFRYNPSQQEAVVPLESRTSGSYTLVFDNTNGINTGLALANRSNQITTLTYILRDGNGTQIGAGTITLAAHGHTAVVLSQQYPATAGILGTIEIDAQPPIQFSALGIRFTATQNVTTVPVLSK